VRAGVVGEGWGQWKRLWEHMHVIRVHIRHLV
jgi:hypothetical protein